ncbi:MAG TPA: NAD-dependent deacylase, partial [Burkholderiales bacterium]|nr:NAD-dependent deacylase [Burkholderiales bacterium]
LFVAVGTSLQVFPIAGALPAARAAGAKVVIVNAEPTAMDGLAHAVIAGSISAILPHLLGSDRAHA